MNDKSVYVIASEEGCVKIGIARDPSSRLNRLKTGNHSKLSLEFTEIYEAGIAKKVERQVHEEFWGSRKNGEWFSVSVQEAITAIRAVAEAIKQGKKSKNRMFLAKQLELKLGGGGGFPSGGPTGELTEQL